MRIFSLYFDNDPVFNEYKVWIMKNKYMGRRC